MGNNSGLTCNVRSPGEARQSLEQRQDDLFVFPAEDAPSEVDPGMLAIPVPACQGMLQDAPFRGRLLD